jgi:NADPH:quinone reductase-like Zn-dependent oxidoreductase
MRMHPLSLLVLLAAAAADLAASADLAPSPGVAASMPERMRAAVVSAGTVRIREVSRPVAGPGEVLVRIRYAGINPADWKTAGGGGEEPALRGAAGSDTAPATPIPGVDGAGVITALGSGVHGYRIGDPVIVWSPARGTYAQYVAVPVTTIARKPPSLSFAEAAGVAHASLAAWNLLIDLARVHPGETVLVLGAAGGVGSAAVQIAHNEGAHVIATASARNAEYLKGLGAQSVFDYATQHFEDQLRNIDIAIDTVDMDNAYRALAVLRRGGQLLSLVGLPSAAQCAARAVLCSGRTLGATPVHEVLQHIADWSRDGRFRVNIDQTFDLTDVLKAWQFSQAGHTRGKSVIRIDD